MESYQLGEAVPPQGAQAAPACTAGTWAHTFGQLSAENADEAVQVTAALLPDLTWQLQMTLFSKHLSEGLIPGSTTLFIYKQGLARGQQKGPMTRFKSLS